MDWPMLLGPALFATLLSAVTSIMGFWALAPGEENMDWSSLVGPAVVAAGVSGIVTTIGFFINRSTTITTHEEKLKADRDLAQKRFEFDKELAEKKFAFDQRTLIQNRRFELAETILADAYRYKDMMAYVRNGFSFGNEGESREAAEDEEEGIKRTRNTYFVPIERLQANNEFISSMMARRYAAESYFAADARNAYGLFREVMHRMQVASSMLIDMAGQRGHDEERRALQDRLLCDLWAGYGEHRNRDELTPKIDEAMSLIEGFCKPALERRAPQ